MWFHPNWLILFGSTYQHNNFHHSKVLLKKVNVWRTLNVCKNLFKMSHFSYFSLLFFHSFLPYILPEILVLKVLVNLKHQLVTCPSSYLCPYSLNSRCSSFHVFSQNCHSNISSPTCLLEHCLSLSIVIVYFFSP